MYRNDKVRLFMDRIIDGCFNYLSAYLAQYDSDEEFREHEAEYRKTKEKVYAIMNKHTYNSMVYSLKPLKLEDWYTPEEIDIITSYTDNAFLEKYQRNK